MKYNLSPYNPELKLVSTLSDQSNLKAYLDERFGEWCYTEMARDAIKIALSYYCLSKEDVVTILTTSGNFYISSCVTNAIETVCKWSREIVPETKLLFVNHEFGYPYRNIEELKKYDLPIIEDCAYTFLSMTSQDKPGKTGDFVIYSLPKIFPIEKGGILVCNNEKFKITSVLGESSIRDINNCLAAAILDIEFIKKKRLLNYRFLLSELCSIGVKPFFNLEEGVIPGVFMFEWREDIDYPRLKAYMQENGVECSVFYGKNAFFIPMHHLLEKEDLLYFCKLIKQFDIHK